MKGYKVLFTPVSEMLHNLNAAKADNTYYQKVDYYLKPDLLILMEKLKDTTLLIDGAYFSEEINKKAEAKGIKMVPTNLVGGTKNSNVDKFEIDEKEHLVKKCPSGYKPITSTFNKGSYRAHFDKKHCNRCPFCKDCPVIKQKKSYEPPPLYWTPG